MKKKTLDFIILKMNKYYRDYSEPNFKSILRLETSSWLVRKFLKGNRKFNPAATSFLVDLDSRKYLIDGRTHVDFSHNRIRKFLSQISRKSKLETDLRLPSNCPIFAEDAVYSGHLLEYLCPYHAYELLSEIFRILKLSCSLRINVPSLDNAIAIYNVTDKDVRFKYRAEAFGNLTQNYLHHSVRCAELLNTA